MLGRDNSHEISAIFHTNARRLFGLLLEMLCQKADISQHELGRRSEAYLDELIVNGHIKHTNKTGCIMQPAICRAVKGKYPLTYTQVFIWLRLLKQVCHISKDLETDMWRLALFGMPDEVEEAFRKYEHMLKERDTEELPAVRRTVKLRQESTQ